jgi:quercetin 2,3-dioxygenase
VSNLERDPRETACGGLATVAHTPTFRLLEPRQVPLGGPRAMVVRRTVPHRELRTVGPWCFVDDYGPTDVAGAAGMQVPPHPHTGLQTVSWLLAGQVLHQDSLGSEQLVVPGQLSLMTAGRGIAHAETSPADRSAVLRGVQLWVALPDAHRHAEPDFAHHPDLPVVEDGGLRARIIVGALGGVASPARAYSPLVGADVSVATGAPVRLPIEADFEHAALALTDGLELDGRPVPTGALVYLGVGRREVTLGAEPGSGGARLLLLGGTPFEEELLMWWNFVGRSHEEIVAARADWEAARMQGQPATRFGEAARFGQVHGYDGPALPAPALPGTRLKPRRRA